MVYPIYTIENQAILYLNNKNIATRDEVMFDPYITANIYFTMSNSENAQMLTFPINLHSTVKPCKRLGRTFSLSKWTSSQNMFKNKVPYCKITQANGKKRKLKKLRNSMLL
jgi:hypothetical protein